MRPLALLIPALVAPSPARAAGGGGSHLLAELWVDAGGPYLVDAGETVTLDASGSRVELCTRAQFAWDLDGDGLVDTTGSTSPTYAFSTAHIDGPHEQRVHVQVTCWLIDELDSIEGSDDAALGVRNAAPTITGVERDAAPREGALLHLSVEFTDPEAADTHVVGWDLGDGATATGEEISHTWVQDGRYEVTVQVTDDDGGSHTFVSLLDVANLPPDLSGSPSTQATVGQPWSFVPLVTDPGLADTHSFRADLPAAATLDTATGEISWTPSAGDVGDHALSLSVEDDAGDGDTLLWTVEVRDAGATDTGSGDGGGGGGGGGDRPYGDGHAQGDPWEGAYPIAGEGCRCDASRADLLAPALLPMALLTMRRRRPLRT